MATNQTELAFAESGEPVVIQMINNMNGTGNIAANDLEIREYGVLARYTDNGNDYLALVPWSNILGLHQAEGV